MKIAEVLSKMGYTEFVVRDDIYDGIEWIEQPEVVPTEEDIENAILAVQAEQDVKTTAKESAIAKLSALGLTEDEIKALVGA